MACRNKMQSGWFLYIPDCFFLSKWVVLGMNKPQYGPDLSAFFIKGLDTWDYRGFQTSH